MKNDQDTKILQEAYNQIKRKLYFAFDHDYDFYKDPVLTHKPSQYDYSQEITSKYTAVSWCDDTVHIVAQGNTEDEFLKQWEIYIKDNLDYDINNIDNEDDNRAAEEIIKMGPIEYSRLRQPDGDSIEGVMVIIDGKMID